MDKYYGKSFRHLYKRLIVRLLSAIVHDDAEVMLRCSKNLADFAGTEAILDDDQAWAQRILNHIILTTPAAQINASCNTGEEEPHESTIFDNVEL